MVCRPDFHGPINADYRCWRLPNVYIYYNVLENHAEVVAFAERQFCDASVYFNLGALRQHIVPI